MQEQIDCRVELVERNAYKIFVLRLERIKLHKIGLKNIKEDRKWEGFMLCRTGFISRSLRKM
jgi:hypothetical protein